MRDDNCHVAVFLYAIAHTPLYLDSINRQWYTAYYCLNYFEDVTIECITEKCGRWVACLRCIEHYKRGLHDYKYIFHT